MVAESTAWRKCFVLRQTEIDMADLKKGDVFRLEGTVDDIHNDPNRWSLATTDAKPCPPPEGNVQVQAEEVCMVTTNGFDPKRKVGFNK